MGTQEGRQALESLEAFIPPDSPTQDAAAAEGHNDSDDSDGQLSDAEEPPAEVSNVSSAHARDLMEAIEDESSPAESAPQADDADTPDEDAAKPDEDADMALKLSLSQTPGATQVIAHGNEDNDVLCGKSAGQNALAIELIWTTSCLEDS